MELLEFLEMLVISALVGGLIGIERELGVKAVAGVRTFMLVSVLGTLSAVISQTMDNLYIVAVALLGACLISLLIGVVKNYRLGDIGVTTSVAFILAFMLGTLVGAKHFLEAIAGSLIITGVLISKKYAREFSKSLTQQEMLNALEFGIVAFILYPVAPNMTLVAVPINPKLLVLVVIIVTSIGFAGFLALRRVGAEKGLPIVGALGALGNSEATTSALASRAKEQAALLGAASLGIVLANVVMLLRNLLVASLISVQVAKLMFAPVAAMAAAGIFYAYFFRLEEKPKESIALELPFAILPAVKFAMLFAAVSLIVNYLKGFGAGSVYFAALLGGFVSSLAVTASLATMSALGSLDASTAAFACVISALGSAFGKLLVSRISGTRELASALLKPMLLAVLAGAAVLALQAAAQ